jgi:endonuclease YncB( thermonuclease family)
MARSSLRPWWRWGVDAATVLVLAALLLYAVDRFEPITWIARVTVVDGDSLRRDGEDIRLHGIDAPELGQQCSDEYDHAYDCGREAQGALRRLIGTSDVQCLISDRDRYGRAVGVCSAGGRELNREMVRLGWAIAYLRHTSRYLTAAREAQLAGRGLWRGAFDFPEDFRIARRGNANGRAGAAGED